MSSVASLRELAVVNPRAAAKEINRLSRLYGDRLGDGLRRELRGVFDKGLSEVTLETGFSGVVRGDDVIERLFGSQQLGIDLLSARDELVTRVFQLLQSSIRSESFSREEIVRGLAGVADRSEAQLRTIARTYSNQFFTGGRRAGYAAIEDSEGVKFFYSHKGPVDGRTTKKCLAVIERTKDGVLWDDYVRIVKEEVSKEMPDFVVDERAPVCGWNCRHLPLRKVS